MVAQLRMIEKCMIGPVDLASIQCRLDGFMEQGIGIASEEAV
jgi:hypothetical protein